VVVAALLAFVACAGPTAVRPRVGATTAAVGAGFRCSTYGRADDPGPAYWERVGRDMAARVPGAMPEAVWIVARLAGEGTRVSFPVAAGAHPLIQGEASDTSEEVLDRLDAAGYRVWLQVEPGMAPMEPLIDLVLDRYGHHSSVIGLGLDVEWYRSTTEPEGQAVTNAEAIAWLAAIRAHDPGYRLFLKHWEAGKLPPTVRDGITFIDDSQIFPSLDAMVAEFKRWGEAFAPAPVGFQFGYPSDRPWWRRLDDPPRRIGEAILAAVPNLAGLYWVDFSVREVFPPDPAVAPAPPPVVGVKIYEHSGDLEPLFAEWRRLGVNAAFAGADLAGRDEFRALATRDGIDLFVVFPVMYAPAELAADPDLYAITGRGGRAQEEWVEVACPSREAFRRRRVAEASDLVRRLNPAGLSIDFIRHYVYWEMVRPDADPDALPDACYCRHCLERFAAASPTRAALPVGDPVAAAAWIRAHAAADWIRFKTETITSLAWEIVQAVRAVRPHITISINVVPWRTDEYAGAITRVAGQDRDALGGIADYLSPMAYSFMLYREPAWIASVVQETARAGRCAVLPAVQVAARYRTDTAYTPEEFEACLRAALAPPSAGVVLWKWEHFAAEPRKLEALRRVLGSRVAPGE
jgi:hypothetical protein